jgi:hypothetical protein
MSLLCPSYPSWLPYRENSLYGQLRKVYEMAQKMSDETFTQVEALPKTVRGKIYTAIGGHPSTKKRKAVHLSEKLPVLQRAIERIAGEMFDALSPALKHAVGSRVEHYMPPQDQEGAEWGVIHAKDHPIVLLMSLEDCYLQVSPRIGAALREWASHGPLREVTDRERAAQLFVSFLRDKKESCLDLSACGLSLLPPIFHLADDFMTRMHSLILAGNALIGLPQEVRQCRGLKKIDLSSNLLIHLPEWIDQLPMLETLNVSRNRLGALPEQIGRSPALQWLDVSYNKLEDLPHTLRELQHPCYLEVLGNPLLQQYPERLLECIPSCVIFLLESDLSSEARNRLEIAMAAKGVQILIAPAQQPIFESSSVYKKLPKTLKEALHVFIERVQRKKIFEADELASPESMAEFERMQDALVVHIKKFIAVLNEKIHSCFQSKHVNGSLVYDAELEKFLHSLKMEVASTLDPVTKEFLQQNPEATGGSGIVTAIIRELQVAMRLLQD